MRNEEALTKLLTKMVSNMSDDQRKHLADMNADPALHYGPGSDIYKSEVGVLARSVHRLIIWRTNRSINLKDKQTAKARKLIDQGIHKLQAALALMRELDN